MPSDDVGRRSWVQQDIADLRARLLGGRGPGATAAEVARDTTDRPYLGGQSAVVALERVHEQAARARGAGLGPDGQRSPIEIAWESQQRPPPAPDSARLPTALLWAARLAFASAVVLGVVRLARRARTPALSAPD